MCKTHTYTRFTFLANRILFHRCAQANSLFQITHSHKTHVYMHTRSIFQSRHAHTKYSLPTCCSHIALDVLMNSVCEMGWSWAFLKVKFWTDFTRDCILPKAHAINRVCHSLTEALEHRVVKEVRNELQIEQNTAPVTDINLLSRQHTAFTIIEMYGMFC